MNILIIEDDGGLGKRIYELFNGMSITNGVTLLHSFGEFIREYAFIDRYDFILTDLNLGNYSLPEGFEIIKNIRNRNSMVPIVVISGYDDIDKLRYAFSLGATDYLIKPIRLKELEVRVCNWYTSYCVSRFGNKTKTYSYHGLAYDLDKNQFILSGQEIKLSKNNKYILSLFFLQPEKILTNTYLGEKIWGDLFYSQERNLRVNICRLKRKLACYGIDEWIQNIHAEGYMFLWQESTPVYNQSYISTSY